MRLEGKTAIVTGAGRGIGRAISETFAREGCYVVVTDIDEAGAEAVAKAIREQGGEAVARKLDVTQRPDVAALVKDVVQERGRLHVMVNNAGVLPGPWTQTLAVNLQGVAFGIRYAARAMAEAGGGSIISTSSINGLVGIGAPPDTGADAYVAAKHGVIGLTREFALAYGPSNVRVNCVCPGYVDTEMVQALAAIGTNRERMANITALKRIAQPQEIANVFLFLASDESSYVTGTVIVADGGATSGHADAVAVPRMGGFSG